MMDFEDPQGTDLKLFETLQQAAETSPRSRLFIYTTGCSIYGKRPERVMDETTPANPEHKLAFRMELEQKTVRYANSALPESRAASWLYVRDEWSIEHQRHVVWHGAAG